MKICEDHGFCLSVPFFQREHDALLHFLAGIEKEELAGFYGCSSRIFEPFYAELLRQDEGICPPASPALLTYGGIAFTSMAPGVFTDRQWTYVSCHLRILSGAYGVLRPLDGICPYRLEMGQKKPLDLYGFWKEKLESVFRHETIVNLASEEYARVVRNAGGWSSWIDVHFYEEENGKRKEKGVYVKIARGTMVRWMAVNQIETPERIRDFDELGYRFDPSVSLPSRYVFVRKAERHE